MLGARGRLAVSVSIACLLASTLACGAVGGAATVRQDRAIRSFDGTRITFHWFPARGLDPGERAPTVLQGPGFGGQGVTDPNAPDEDAIPGVGPLRRAGYNVSTWNPRGISPTGGKAQLNAASFEGRDTSALISWVARQPQAQLDAPGDPRIGMTGGSYGGGIQLTTAAIDHRVDAIVPVIAWHSLMSSLYQSRTIKTSWVRALVTLASLPGNHFDPAILKGAAQAAAGRRFTPDVIAFGKAAGPAGLVAQIRAPTLIIQGTIDNLFPPTEAVDNYRALRRNAVPAKMIWYCGGHGFCLTGTRDGEVAQRQTRRWLAKYLKGEPVSTGAGFTWVDQRGRTFRAPSYPPAPLADLTAQGSGELQLRAGGGSGPYRGPLRDPVSPVVAEFLRPTVPTRARNAVNVPILLDRQVSIVGRHGCS